MRKRLLLAVRFARSSLAAACLAARRRRARARAPGASRSTAGSIRRRCARSSRPSRSRRASTVSVRSDDEGVLASQIVQEGSHSPADVFFTENSPPLEALAGARPARPRRRLDAREDAGRGTARPQGSGPAVSARVSTIVYNTDKLKPSQLPKSVLDLANPKWKGKLALAPTETDFQPIVTAVAAQLRQGAHGQVARGDQGQRERPHLPRQRDARRPGEQRPGRARRDQPLLLVPPARRARRRRRCTPPMHFFAPRRPRLRDRRLRRRHPQVELAPGRGAEVPRVPRQPRRRRRSSPTTRASSTRSAPASSTARGRSFRSRRCGPIRSRSSSSATARARSRCSAQRAPVAGRAARVPIGR